MVSYRALYRRVCRTLEEAGVESAAFESMQLLSHFCGIDRSRLLLLGDQPAPPQQFEALLQAAGRRAAHYPLQYLLGEWEFYGLPFSVGEGVLIPRADTETLVDCALEFLRPLPAPRVADLCSGSGCIAVAVAKTLPGSRVSALELSAGALPYLRENVRRNGVEQQVEILACDVLSQNALASLDAVLSNPPYIRSDALAALQAEVRHEPAMALDGDRDGLRFYREITRLYTPKLRPGGLLAYEVGYDQSDAVLALLQQHGYTGLGVRRDLFGVARVVFGKRGTI